MLWWLLFTWISAKIFRKQTLEWKWYKKAVEKTFIIAHPVYKGLFGIVIALTVFAVLISLPSLIGYGGSDLEKLFE